MIDLTKLKMGDRVQFAPNTLAICSSPTFETDVSNLKGTVVNFDKPFNANTFTHVWIELDIKHEEFDCDSVCEMDSQMVMQCPSYRVNHLLTMLAQFWWFSSSMLSMVMRLCWLIRSKT